MSEIKKSSQRKKKISSNIHVDDKFLQDHMRDVRAEMSWRRELEFRFLQLLLVLYPIIGSIMVQLFQSKDVNALAFRITAGFLAILILAISYFVIARIEREHEAYAKLGKQVQKIWEYFGLFEPGAYLDGEAFLSTELRDKNEGIGQGMGYRKTQILIGGLTAVILFILTALAYLKT